MSGARTRAISAANRQTNFFINSSAKKHTWRNSGLTNLSPLRGRRDAGDARRSALYLKGISVEEGWLLILCVSKVAEAYADQTKTLSRSEVDAISQRKGDRGELFAG